MLHIKKFFDKVTMIESRQSKDLVLPIADARGLRDEVANLLMELRLLTNKEKKEEIIKVEITGGKFTDGKNST